MFQELGWLLGYHVHKIAPVDKELTVKEAETHQWPILMELETGDCKGKFRDITLHV